MTRPKLELTFQRHERAAQPEAFRQEPQRYRRVEGDRVVADAKLPWDATLSEPLDRLARNRGDAEARLKVGAVLRDFLTQLGWTAPEALLGRGPGGGGQEEEEPLLLTIRSAAAELYPVPWELMTDPVANQHLADLPDVLVRYEWPGLPPVPLSTEEGPARVVFAWSGAGGSVPAAEHCAALETAIKPVPGVQLVEIPNVTERTLAAELERKGPVVLHVLCHGLAAAGDAGALRWGETLAETRTAAGARIAAGGAQDIDAHGLKTLLGPVSERLRLVVLCACHSGDARPEGLFLGSMAQAIHRVGVRAVVGSRYSLSKWGSVRLTRVLYGALLGKGTSLERALLRARVALHHPGGKAGPEDAGDEHGRLSEDAYALQFYARSVEEVRAADGKPAKRDVTATYPFGGGRAEKKAPFHVPFFKNEGFVGREGDLENLHALLQQGEAVGVRPAASGPHPAALTGMGGIGKTQLAVEYAYQYRDAYPSGVYWVNAAQRWQAELASLAEKLDLREDSAAEADRERRLALAFGRYLDEHPGALVIFDNVEDPLALREPTPDLIPARLPCRVLFTTRRRDPDSPFATLDVPVLPPDAALPLLLSSEARRRLLSDGPESEIQAAKAICSALGYLPLAIVLASAYLGKFTSVAPSKYLTGLRNNGVLAAVDAGNVDRRKLATHHVAAVEATLRAQWDVLESEDARLVLKTATLLREAAQVQRATLSLLTGLGDEAKDGWAAPLEEALHELSSLSLVEDLTERAIRLHPLVREFAERRIGKRDAFAAASARRLGEALWDMGRLNAEVASRGVDAVLEDLREGKRLSLTGEGARIERLMRPLDREANHLRRWDPEQAPAFLLQQLRNRCFELELEDLQKAAEAKLDERRLPHLRERIRTSRESDALVRTLEGHTYAVEGVAVTPDGRFAVSASADKTLKVWELSTGQAVRTLKGHSDRVNDVEVTPDGRFAVSASHDQTLKVWELSTGQLVRTLAGHTAWVKCVAMTPDGRFAVSASDDHTLKVWELSTGQVVRTHKDHPASLLGGGVAVTPDGRFAVFASDDRIKVWKLLTGHHFRTLKGHTNNVNCVAVMPDGRFAVSASDKTLEVWELSTGQVVRTLEGHTSRVFDVAVTPDGRFAVSASDDTTLKVWELSAGQAVRNLEGHTDEVIGMAVTSDGRFAVTASDDCTLKVWDLSAGQAVRTLKDHTAWVGCVAVTPDGRFAVSGTSSSNKILKVWDLSTGQAVRILEGNHTQVMGVAVTPDGRSAIFTSFDRASFDRTLKVWDLSTGQAVRTLEGHTDSVFDIAVTPDGRFAVTASSDQTLKVWELSTGQAVRILEDHTDSVTCVAVTPDGRFAVSGSSDRTRKVWELSTGQVVRTLEGHTHSVMCVAVTPEGRFAISASSDNTLRGWELSTGQTILILGTHAPLRCCAVTSKGKTFLAGDAAGGMHILDWLHPPRHGL